MSSMLARVRRFMDAHHMSATRFGREAVNDPRFVLDLANGREPRAATVRRVEAFIAERSAAAR